VIWLRRQLAEADNRPVSEPVSELFDAELAQRVREFQRRHGLQADGLAGPDTLLILTSLAPAPDTPRLVPAGLGQV
jgi:general secretion pathway protein A